jgi:hypothetical protein
MKERNTMKHRSNTKRHQGGLLQSLLFRKHAIVLWLLPAVFLFAFTFFSIVDNRVSLYFPSFAYGVVLLLMTFVVNHYYFSFIHRGPAADFFYALPLSRSGLYLRLNTSAIINLLAPSFIMAALHYFLMYLRDVRKNFPYSVGGQDFTAYWTSFASLMIKILLFFFIMQIFYFISEKTSSAVTMFILVNIFWPLVVLFFTDATASFLPGLIAPSLASTTGISLWLIRVIQLFSPMSAFFLSSDMAFDLFPLALLALSALAAWYLFKKRQAEHSRQAGALRRPVMVTHWMVTLGVSLLGGYICHYLRVASASVATTDAAGAYSPAPFMIGVALGLILSLWVFNLIQGKGKIKWKAIIRPAAAAAVPLAVWLAIVTTGASGFSLKTPQASDVEKVTITYHNSDHEGAKLTTKVSLTDERDIEDFMKLYGQTVSSDNPGMSVPRNLSSREQLRYFIEYQGTMMSENRYGANFDDAEFTITMKNGQSFNRSLPLLRTPANENYFRLFIRNRDYQMAEFTFDEVLLIYNPDFAPPEILVNENLPAAKIPGWVSALQNAVKKHDSLFIYEIYMMRRMIAHHLLSATEEERADYIDQAPCVMRIIVNEIAIKGATEPLIFDYPVNPDRLKPLAKLLEDLQSTAQYSAKPGCYR